MTVADRIFQNGAWAGASPRLSVLIPFLGDDPTDLIAFLGAQAPNSERNGGQVEIIAFDDGGQDEALGASVQGAVERLSGPGMLIRSGANLGRAKGRNRLAESARGDWLLFLDADMAPDSDRFLATYLDLIETEAPAVAFGGLSLKQAPNAQKYALHRQMAAHSDCATVEIRRASPEKHVFTSNLLVERAAFSACGFDESFTGWGWEDVEWAMRVADRHPIVHVDNPATHLGLDPAPVIARKYEQSAGNFARVARDHRHIVERYPSYRAAKLLKKVPLRGAWRPVLKGFALAEAAPLAARAFAMRLYRAALYAEAV